MIFFVSGFNFPFQLDFSKNVEEFCANCLFLGWFLAEIDDCKEKFLILKIQNEFNTLRQQIESILYSSPEISKKIMVDVSIF